MLIQIYTQEDKTGYHTHYHCKLKGVLYNLKTIHSTPPLNNQFLQEATGLAVSCGLKPKTVNLEQNSKNLYAIVLEQRTNKGN